MVEGEFTEPSAESLSERWQELAKKVYSFVCNQLKKGEDYHYLGTENNDGLEAQSFELFYSDADSFSDEEINMIRKFMHTPRFERFIGGQLKNIQLTDITENGVIITFFVQMNQNKTEKEERK